MRRKLIAGNWKMNLNRVDSVALAQQIVEQLGKIDGVEIAICPPSIYQDVVSGVIAGSQVKLGAQNMHHESAGAYTGEISPAMLIDVGCRFVILGHSERRHILGETDHMVNQKTVAALQAGLQPIVCVGETLDEREAGRTGEVIEQQFARSLAGLTVDQIGRIAIAYEPVWAIGTGKVATPKQAEEVHGDLRRMLTNGYNADIAGQVRIQYGGSVKPDNAAALLAQENIDGALVGGASLQAESFAQIVAAA